MVASSEAGQERVVVSSGVVVQRSIEVEAECHPRADSFSLHAQAPELRRLLQEARCLRVGMIPRHSMPTQGWPRTMLYNVL